MLEFPNPSPPGPLAWVPHMEQVYFCTFFSSSVNSAKISNIDETHFLARGQLAHQKAGNQYIAVNKQTA